MARLMFVSSTFIFMPYPKSATLHLFTGANAKRQHEHRLLDGTRFIYGGQFNHFIANADRVVDAKKCKIVWQSGWEDDEQLHKDGQICLLRAPKITFTNSPRRGKRHWRQGDSRLAVEHAPALSSPEITVEGVYLRKKRPSAYVIV